MDLDFPTAWSAVTTISFIASPIVAAIPARAADPFAFLHKVVHFIAGAGPSTKIALNGAPKVSLTVDAVDQEATGELSRQ